MKYLFKGLLALLTVNLLAQEQSSKRKHLPIEIMYFGGVQFNHPGNLNSLLKDPGAG
ncbi:exported hypothetical protein [Sphingobacterium sp. PM2-P1-29]|nr:exported hypothetical protein [Sphingobacterium sp. PM2-P1-29]